MTLKLLPGSGLDVEEPDWEQLIPDQGLARIEASNDEWRQLAHREWMRLVAAMRDAGTLGPENRHQIQRLVVSYVRYDRATAMMFKAGELEAKLWHAEMRQADNDATTAEMELGIPPRRRGAVMKSKRVEKKAPNAAQAYLAKRG